MPSAGSMINLSPAFSSPVLKGIKIDPDNPLRFEFILDQGDSLPHASKGRERGLKEQASRLVKYFLAGLTIPEKDLWVNLSPYEKDRIVPESFGQTTMGRDLLAEDYMLKQVTASLIYPECETGKKFWVKIYAESARRFGTTNVPINTFNKVWIVPEKAVVYQNAKARTAYVLDSKLKVMLEQDYLSLKKHEGIPAYIAKGAIYGVSTNMLATKIAREIVIPELTKEINEGRNFSQLRQVYNSLILATWYKKTIKDSILEQVYADRNKVAGVNIDDPKEKQRIYERYLQAFKKGVFNYIKNTDMPEGVSVQRKYFSGGFGFNDMAMRIEIKNTGMPTTVDNSRLFDLTTDMAMTAKSLKGNKKEPIRVFRKLRNERSKHGIVLSIITHQARASWDGYSAMNVLMERNDLAMKTSEDQNIKVDQEELERINKEKLRLIAATKELIEKLPSNSPWRKYWMKGSEVPASEMVYEPGNAKRKGIIRDKYQVAYYLNYTYSRELILEFITDLINQKVFLDKRTYGLFLNSIHRAQIIGRNHETIYIGSNIGVRPIKLDKRTIFMIVKDVVEGKYDLTDDFVNKDLQESLDRFKDYINLKSNASNNDIVRSIANFYRSSTLYGSLPFGSGKVNNSVFMNIVNTMLRLKGFNGIDHDLDTLNHRDLSEKDFFKLFLKKVNAALIVSSEKGAPNPFWNNDNIAKIFNEDMIKHLPVRIGLANIKNGPDIKLEIKFKHECYKINVFVGSVLTGKILLNDIPSEYQMPYFVPIGYLETEVNNRFTKKGISSTILNWLAWTAKENGVLLSISGTRTVSLIRLFNSFISGETKQLNIGKNSAGDSLYVVKGAPHPVQLPGITLFNNAQLASQPENAAMGVLEDTVAEDLLAKQVGKAVENGVNLMPGSGVEASKDKAMNQAQIIRENKKYVKWPDKVILPDEIRIALIREGIVYFKGPYYLGDDIFRFYYKLKPHVNSARESEVGYLLLSWDGDTYSWKVVDHKIDKDYRSLGLGRQAVMQLIKYFGVMRSSYDASNSAINMWVKLGAVKENYHSLYDIYFLRDKTNPSNKTGGIDLTPVTNVLQTLNAGQPIKFPASASVGYDNHINPAQLAQLQDAPGFVPLIINIQPLKSLQEFLQ